MNVSEELLDVFVDLVVIQHKLNSMTKGKWRKEGEGIGLDDACMNKPVDVVDQMVLDQEIAMVDAEQLGAMEFVRYFSAINVTNQLGFFIAFE